MELREGAEILDYPISESTESGNQGEVDVLASGSEDRSLEADDYAAIELFNSREIIIKKFNLLIIILIIIGSSEESDTNVTIIEINSDGNFI